METVVVDGGPDVADKWIAERAGPGDICITGDIPLAARCIEGGPAGEAQWDVLDERISARSWRCAT